MVTASTANSYSIKFSQKTKLRPAAAGSREGAIPKKFLDWRRLQVLRSWFLFFYFFVKLFFEFLVAAAAVESGDGLAASTASLCGSGRGGGGGGRGVNLAVLAAQAGWNEAAVAVAAPGHQGPTFRQLGSSSSLLLVVPV